MKKWRTMLTKTIIDGLEVEYNIVHRKIKYPRLELKTGNLLLVVPKGYKNPEKLIEEHKEWIHNKISAIKESKERSKGKKLNLNRDLENKRLSLTEEQDSYLRTFINNYCKKTFHNCLYER